MNSPNVGRTLSSTLGLALVLVVAGCANQPAPRVEGRLASGGGYLGDWDLYPDHCTKRGDEIVLDQGGDTKRRVRLIDRSRGGPSSLAKIEIRVAGDTPAGPREILLTDASCLKGSIDGSGGKSVGDIQFNCQTGEGGHIVGKVRFEDCR
jgi:hypothetical protein